MKSDMRVTLTKRLLKEGLLRMLERETLSKISITELCEESGVNRATFYKHYESPAMILRDIAYDYDEQMSSIYEAVQRAGGSEEDRIEACMQFLLERKAVHSPRFSCRMISYPASVSAFLTSSLRCDTIPLQMKSPPGLMWARRGAAKEMMTSEMILATQISQTAVT